MPLTQALQNDDIEPKAILDICMLVLLWHFKTKQWFGAAYIKFIDTKRCEIKPIRYYCWHLIFYLAYSESYPSKQFYLQKWTRYICIYIVISLAKSFLWIGYCVLEMRQVLRYSRKPFVLCRFLLCFDNLIRRRNIYTQLLWNSGYFGRRLHNKAQYPPINLKHLMIWEIKSIYWATLKDAINLH